MSSEMGIFSFSPSRGPESGRSHGAVSRLKKPLHHCHLCVSRWALFRKITSGALIGQGESELQELQPGLRREGGGFG